MIVNQSSNSTSKREKSLHSKTIERGTPNFEETIIFKDGKQITNQLLKDEEDQREILNKRK